MDLGLDLVRHEVQEPDLERADILTDRHGLGHYPYTLMHEGFESGQRIGNLDGHGLHSINTKKPAAIDRDRSSEIQLSSAL
ncbi:hypothetical protein D9M70_490460 [compost metagenome]